MPMPIHVNKEEKVKRIEEKGCAAMSGTTISGHPLATMYVEAAIV